MSKVSKIRWFIGMAVLAIPVFLVVGYYGVLYVVWERDPNFIQADLCLDAGGVWDSGAERCWYAGECEDEGGFWYPAESRCAHDEEFHQS